MNPLVSIIIPAFNKANLTAKTVESVLAQTYPNVEIIVVDDGSTDDTREKLAPFHGRIQYVYKENGGACSARNAGLRLAKGEYVGFLDCDDLYVSNKIELSAGYLEQHKDAGFVHTAAYFIDRDDNIVVGEYSHPQSYYNGWITRRLILGNYICNSTVIARRSCFDKAGLFDETIFPPADWDMWLRLSEHYSIGYIDIPLTKYRVCNNYIFKRLEQSRQEEFVVINKFFERNLRWNSFLKNQAISNLHLRYTGCYLLHENHPALKKEFLLCLKANPFNFKALFLFSYFLVAASHLKMVLRRKILRGSTLT